MASSSWSEPAASDHESARLLAEAEHHAAGRRSAARAVASGARDIADARLLLGILGLDVGDIRAAIAHEAEHAGGAESAVTKIGRKPTAA
jgi:hypothetical protein